jgi:hypothetical protein
MGMEPVEIIKTGVLVLGVLSPLVSLVFFSGVVIQRIKNLELLITRFMAQAAECKKDRECTEDKLHDRCTQLNQRVSYLEGRQNGHDH